jgi:fumarate hydratase class II
MPPSFRTEKDSMGEMQVPVEALYGASTARAVENFPVSYRPVPAAVIHAFGHLKAACAQANLDLGKLDKTIAQAIIEASNEVAEGKHDVHFPVDVYQTGSGTSTNMNANEVIANLATQRLRLRDESAKKVHPNDHVNVGQSSNDTFPTAMNIAGALLIDRQLVPALQRLHNELSAKAKKWDTVVKIGRTHLMDATPIRMGQVFAGYAAAAKEGACRANRALADLVENMPIGGTAVGTGINTHLEFGKRVCDGLTVQLRMTDSPFAEAADHCEAQATRDSFVSAHAHLKTIAVSLTKIANDIRWLGSGPRCGIFELMLPEIQPGSSIMPGKVNPVICESVIQVACRVIGNDAVVTTAGLGGVGSIFELNVAMPVMIDAFLESVTLLANVCNVFVDKLLVGLQVNEERCASLIEQSLMMVTSLAPVVGYDNAAKLAKQAFKENKTIRQLVTEQKLVEPAKLNELLDPDSMTRPGGSGGGGG